ncbi:Neuropeptide FF receptor 1 [Tyrophagus putrescentiae]|nr:Neuropeptide FF receptor 1 [Tyrophagus putrescentiae]
MDTAKLTRRLRRKKSGGGGGGAGDTFWPPTMNFLFVLATSSPISTSTFFSSSLSVCDAYVVPSVQRLADGLESLVERPPLPPMPSMKMNTTNSFSFSSSADLNLNASDLFYPLDLYLSDKIEQQQQHQQQQDMAATLMDIHHNCPPEVHNENVPAIFLVNGSRSFEDTLLQLKERLLLENANSPPFSHNNNYSLRRNRSVGSPDDPRQEALNSNQATVFWNVLLLVGYGLILVVSLPGNLLVCRIIISTPKLRTATNILILSLTASSLYVSTFTMKAIGIHRFKTVRPSKPHKPYSPFVVLPLTVTAGFYAKIAIIIQRQRQLARHFCDKLNRRAVEAKRKRSTMLIIGVAAFAIS